MTALMSSGWSGMGVIEDIDRGLLDRFLAGPTHRSSLIVGRIGYEGDRARDPGPDHGRPGLAAGRHVRERTVWASPSCIGVAVLVAFTIASLSCAMALTLRQRESVIGVNTMLTLPLTFLSAAFMPLALAPDWIETVADVQPDQLGRSRRAARRCWRPRTGRSSCRASAGWRSWRIASRRPGHAGLPQLPALGLTHRGGPVSEVAAEDGRIAPDRRRPRTGPR